MPLPPETARIASNDSTRTKRPAPESSAAGLCTSVPRDEEPGALCTPTPRDEEIDALGRSERDYSQECELRAWKYYRRRYENLTTDYKQQIRKRLEIDAKRRKKTMNDKEPLVTYEVQEYHERIYREDAATAERRVDLKRAFDRLVDDFGVTICHAAAGEITANEACRRLGGDRNRVLREIQRANEEAKRLLRDYRDVLPADLQAKYAA